MFCAKQKSTDVLRLTLSHHLAWLQGGRGKGGKGSMAAWVSVVLERAARLVRAGSARAPCVCVLGCERFAAVCVCVCVCVLCTIN